MKISPARRVKGMAQITRPSRDNPPLVSHDLEISSLSLASQPRDRFDKILASRHRKAMKEVRIEDMLLRA